MWRAHWDRHVTLKVKLVQVQVSLMNDVIRSCYIQLGNTENLWCNNNNSRSYCHHCHYHKIRLNNCQDLSRWPSLASASASSPHSLTNYMLFILFLSHHWFSQPARPGRSASWNTPCDWTVLQQTAEHRPRAEWPCLPAFFQILS